jgi:HJR/Mrr/RecB family endonuclease
MAKRVGFFERVVDRLVRHTSGRTALAVGLVLYPGVGLVLPLSLGFSTYYMVLFNLVGVVMMLVIALAWTGVIFDTAQRRHLLDWTTELRHLSASEFEWLVGEVFRREGWAVQETGSTDGPDGNVDLVLTKPGSRVIVQCKRWEARPVGVDAIRIFLGTLLREHLSPDSGIFVTLSTFTDTARAEARASGLHLMDGPALHARIDRVRWSEPCPLCKSPMTLGKSQYGWWLRCRVPGCSGKRDLGRIPELAAELLMNPPAY